MVDRRKPIIAGLRTTLADTKARHSGAAAGLIGGGPGMTTEMTVSQAK
ncbi:MAG: hypothetical protein OJF55_002664 [Rhodanobacteraceae bacterium]|nr:MAG: hypothetical protein OJF55_002664 [Rhodanobacteraceae bacterium]